MYGSLIVVHIFASLILIAVILLQAGRGGGLSEIFGGRGLEQTIFGTRATTFLTRITTIAAIVFILTSLSLAVISSRRSKSLIEMEKIQKGTEEETEVKVSKEEPYSKIPPPEDTGKSVSE